MDLHTPENERVLAYLTRHGPEELLVAPAASSVDPYSELGSHPDAVERVWDQLGATFPPESRQIVSGNPALIDSSTGLIFALSFGTAYVLRLSEVLLARAKQEGFESVRTWSNGTTSDLERELGPGWIFGMWSDQELTWLQKAYSAPTMR